MSIGIRREHRRAFELRMHSVPLFEHPPKLALAWLVALQEALALVIHLVRVQRIPVRAVADVLDICHEYSALLFSLTASPDNQDGRIAVE